MTKEEKKKGGGFLKGALIGAAAGAAAGILLAPKSGKETRKVIKNKAVDLKDKGAELAGEVKEVLEKGKDFIADKAGDAKDAVAGIAEDAKKEIEKRQK